MYISYSALTENQSKSAFDILEDKEAHELRLRFDAYLKTCQKFKNEITAVQKYFPGWVPGFSRV